MESIKVLIIDRNILVRRAFTNTLKKYSAFDVSWVADGFSTIENKINKFSPDVVLLSIDDMASDELAVLSMIQQNFPGLPVIVISPRTKEGAEAAITSLQLGAVDFITKPQQKNLILFAERHLEKRLNPLIKAAKISREYEELDRDFLESLTHPQKAFEEVEKTAQVPPGIVVIGGCTGGVQALFSMVEALPANLQVPIVIVQHLPRFYTKFLAKKLEGMSNITVREAEDGESLDEGGVWIAPGGYQCEIGQAAHKPVLNIHRGLRENNMRPSIDVLFHSAANFYGKNTLGILLSGCGYDGLSGVEEIKRREGQVIVQDPRTAIAPELPLSVIRKGISKEYYSAEDLAAQIVQRTSVTESKTVEEHPENYGDATVPF